MAVDGEQGVAMAASDMPALIFVDMDPTALAHLRHELRPPLNHIIGYGEIEKCRRVGCDERFA